jgi:hypothetical protein
MAATKPCKSSCLSGGTKKMVDDLQQQLTQCTEYNNITYELLGLVIERSNNIIPFFKVLENIRIDA